MPAQPPQVLAGRVALVTGSSRGIGRAHALALAAHGAKVVVNSPTPNCEKAAAEIRAAGGQAIAHIARVEDYAAAGGLVQAALDEWGRLDILVNNVGASTHKTIEELTLEDWKEMASLNLDQHFNMIKHAVGPMKTQGYGRIINTASGTWRKPIGTLAYGVSKAGVVAFTWGLAFELYGTGVTCNAVAPAAFTDMVAHSLHDFEHMVAEGRVDASKLADLKAMPPPEYVPPIVVFLASEAAARITGMVFRATR